MSSVGMKYRFRFFKPSDGQLKVGILASFNVEIWLGNICQIRSTNWNVREGKNGVWAAPPSYKYSKDGESKYGKYVTFWPKTDDGDDSTDHFNNFNTAFLNSYNAWVNESIEQNDNLASTFAPPTRPTVSASLAPTLPSGWSRQFNEEHKKFYYLYADGKKAYWEDSDEGKALVASVAATSVPLLPPVVNTKPVPTPVNVEPINPFDEVLDPAPPQFNFEFPPVPPVPKRK